MKFYIGLYRASDAEKLKVPHMISIRTVRRRLKVIWGEDWLLDSGGFTELALYGEYRISEEEYIRAIQYHRPTLAFCQDWMCEPEMLEKTGFSIDTHQRLTLASYFSLLDKSPRISPVLQGWEPEDYLTHGEMYEKAGADMTQVFGLGSVCARATTAAPAEIICAVKTRWPQMKLHAFGLKITAFKNPEIVKRLWSADSMSWGIWGSKESLGCQGCKKKSCSNCWRAAAVWRARVMSVIAGTERSNEVHVVSYERVGYSKSLT